MFRIPETEDTGKKECILEGSLDVEDTMFVTQLFII